MAFKDVRQDGTFIQVYYNILIDKDKYLTLKEELGDSEFAKIPTVDVFASFHGDLDFIVKSRSKKPYPVSCRDDGIWDRTSKDGCLYLIENKVRIYSSFWVGLINGYWDEEECNSIAKKIVDSGENDMMEILSCIRKAAEFWHRYYTYKIDGVSVLTGSTHSDIYFSGSTCSIYRLVDDEELIRRFYKEGAPI